MRVADFFEPVCSEAVIGHRVERVPASPMPRRGDTIRWAASRPAAVPWPRDFDGGARCRRGVTGEGAGPPVRRAPARTYQVRTYGCQMNVHDSERLAGLLEAAGYRRATDGSEADVVVFNTCAVRENADNRLYGNLSHLARASAPIPTCKSRSVAAWRKKTATPCCAGRRG